MFPCLRKTPDLETHETFYFANCTKLLSKQSHFELFNCPIFKHSTNHFYIFALSEAFSERSRHRAYLPTFHNRFLVLVVHWRSFHPGAEMCCQTSVGPKPNIDNTLERRATAVGVWLSMLPTSATVLPTHLLKSFWLTRGAVDVFIDTQRQREICFNSYEMLFTNQFVRTIVSRTQCASRPNSDKEKQFLLTPIYIHIAWRFLWRL